MNLQVMQYDNALPIAVKSYEIKAALVKRQVMVIAGETASGKTTQLPKICLEIGGGPHGLIGHTQPQRLAARKKGDRSIHCLLLADCCPSREAAMGRLLPW